MLHLKVPFCETLRLTWHNKLGQCHQAIQCNQRVKIGGVHRSICFYINFHHTGLKRLSKFSQSLIICPQIGTYLHYLLRLDPQISLICILLKYYYFFLPRSNIRTRNKFLKCSQQRNAKTQNLANSCRSLFSKVELSSLKVFITGHKEPHNNK